MTPTHPKLRDALLLDPTHRKRGLTPALFRDYETLLGQLFYVVNYPQDQEKGASRKGASPKNVADNSFKITHDVLRALNAAGVPYCVLKTLEDALLDDEIITLDKFEAYLREYLGNDYNCYHDLIVEEAIVPAVQPVPPQPSSGQLVEDIIEFRNQYMPNYQPIYDNWLKQQKIALQSDQLGLGGLLGQSLAIILLWLKNKPGKGLSNFLRTKG